MTTLYLPRLRPDQWAIVQHPAKIKVIAMGRRWGKTTLSGCVGLATAAQGAKVCWWVPNYRNARPVWAWVEQACAGLEKTGAVRLNRAERYVRFPYSGGYLAIFSADNDVAGRGDWWHLAVLDEASRIREETWTEVIQPSLADADGEALLPSTPMGRNWFWRLWQEGYSKMDGDMAAFRAPSSANPMPTIRRAYERARERGPDNVFRQEWEAEFVADAFDIFTRELFKDRRYHASEHPPPLHIVGRYLSWDTALKDKDTSDFCACVVGELSSDYRLRIVDVWRDRLAFPNLLPQMARMRQKWNYDGKLVAEIIEDKGSGTSAHQTLAAALPEDEAHRLVAFLPVGSKEQRASQAAVWCKEGGVCLPWPSPLVPWLHPFEAELFDFPSASNDDQVDAFSQLIQYLEHYLAEGVHGRKARVQSPTGPRREL